jgi:hypothetical protein
MRTVLTLCFATSLLFACRGSDSDNKADAGGDNPDADISNAVTIYDVQSDNMPVGTSVTLHNVVVTAIDAFGGRTGGIYVQETAGGAYSGVFVFVPASVSATLAVGDLVDVIGGVKDEFALQSDETGRKLTEVSPPEGGSIQVNKIEAGTVPDPEVLNPWDLAADDAEAEKWEGVLVKFDNVSALSSPYGVSSTDDTLKEMEITGPFRVGGSLTDLSDTIVRDDCFVSITGIGDYFFNYKILPRSSADIVTGGDACLPPEDTAALCDDGMDNDYDGFPDCADYSCDKPTGDETLCDKATTVVEIQNETFDPATGRAVLSGAVITAIGAGGFWVQDAANFGEYNGLFVYGDVGSAAVGESYDLKGRIGEFHSVTQMSTIDDLGSATAVGDETATTSTIGTLVGADAEKWEGVLVTVENVSVSMAADPDPMTGTHGQFVVTDGSDTLYVDDYVFSEAEVGADMNDCLTITGLMHFNDADDPQHVTLLPRDAGDIVDSAGCI